MLDNILNNMSEANINMLKGACFVILFGILVSMFSLFIRDLSEIIKLKKEARKNEREKLLKIPSYGELYSNYKKWWKIIEKDSKNIKYDYWTAYDDKPMFFFTYGHYHIILWNEGNEYKLSLHHHIDLFEGSKKKGKGFCALCDGEEDAPNLVKELINKFTYVNGRLPDATEINNANLVVRHGLCN